MKIKKKLSKNGKYVKHGKYVKINENKFLVDSMVYLFIIYFVIQKFRCNTENMQGRILFKIFIKCLFKCRKEKLGIFCYVRKILK